MYVALRGWNKHLSQGGIVLRSNPNPGWPKNQVSPYPLCLYAMFGSPYCCTFPRTKGIIIWGTRVLYTPYPFFCWSYPGRHPGTSRVYTYRTRYLVLNTPLGKLYSYRVIPDSNLVPFCLSQHDPSMEATLDKILSRGG